MGWRRNSSNEPGLASQFAFMIPLFLLFKSFSLSIMPGWHGGQVTGHSSAENGVGHPRELIFYET
ncbi:hypothetical protein P154DRAFT_137329 [Amniculicola lignicola CBS 123094]|uniref:Uncharacterized protein n=1 Tax=Amniculicola lignicola CBS 123094 TaxID=1392246 RepID=A0A6A5WYV7_9PLEO|nr:hypothetical protein P154DRAFT_137329 [Amniculicola lignicola CBS 123094]